MKKSMFQKVICFVLSVATLFGVVAFSASAAVRPSEEELADRLKGENSSAATLQEMMAVVGTSSYSEYIQSFPENIEKVEQSIPVYDSSIGNDKVIVEDTVNSSNTLRGDAANVFNSDDCKDSYNADQSAWPDFEMYDPEDPTKPGKDANGIYLSATSKATWTFAVPKAGLYNIRIAKPPTTLLF